MNLEANQNRFLNWDAFKAPSTPHVKARLAELDIVDLMVSKNLTHLLSYGYYHKWYNKENGVQGIQ